MEFINVVRNRRSVRKYNGQKVRNELVLKIIETGMMAPSSCNQQHTRFIVIDDKKILSKIVHLGAATFIKNAPVSILVLIDKSIRNIEYQDDIQTGAAVIENMLLEATNNSLGSCWVCNLPSEKKIKKLLNISSSYKVIGLVTLGYYDVTLNDIKRKHSVKEVTGFNNDDRFKEVTGNTKRLRSILIYIYKHIPKHRLIVKLADKYIKKFDN